MGHRAKGRVPNTDEKKNRQTNKEIKMTGTYFKVVIISSHPSKAD